MGMTPTDGLIMPSRSGSIDPAIMLHLIEARGMTPAALSNLINCESGMKEFPAFPATFTLSGSRCGRRPPRLAGTQSLLLPGAQNIGPTQQPWRIDVLAFTGDIGESSATVRSLACQDWPDGYPPDEEKNAHWARASENSNRTP